MPIKKSMRQGRSTISFHVEKHKKTAVNGIGRHNERQPGQKHSNKNIDDTKTPENVTLIGDGGRTSYTQRIDKIIDEHYKSPRKIRKDAVFMVGGTIQIGGSAAEYSQKEQIELLTQMSEWLKQEFPHVVSATIHVDETTPHLHYDFVPLTKDGRLCAKEVTGQTQLRRYNDACLKYAQEHFPRAGFERQSEEKRVMNGMKQKQFEQYTAWKEQKEDEIEQEWDEIDERDDELDKREEQLDEREKALISRSDALNTQEGEIDRAKQKIDERAREVAQSEQVIESKIEELKKRSVKNANDREQLTAIANDLAQKLEDINKREQALIMNEQRLREREKEQDEREKALEEKERKLNEMLKAMKDAITSMGSALYRRAHEVFFKQTRTMEQTNRDVIMADESKQDEMLTQGAEKVVRIGVDNDIKPVEKVVKTVDKINEPKDLRELDWSELIGDLQKQNPVQKQTPVEASEREHPQHGWR